MGFGYVSRSCDRPKKESFDGLHKRLKNDFGIEFPFWEILMADISGSCDWKKWVLIM